MISTPEPVPIARSRTGSPIAYAALGLAFHLEPLAADDAPRLAQATTRIVGALGARLRWAWSSVHPEVEPFTPDVLELVSSYPAQLAADAGEGFDDPRARAGAMAMTAARYDKFGVACHGGAERNLASPVTVRFYAVARPDETGGLRADAMIAATMPLETPPSELDALARALAQDLRIRWGAAGLAYGAWELDRYGETRAAIYAHARRHPGFDVGQHATWMRELSDRARTVSWLTFLGPELAERVRAAGQPLASGALVTVEPCGEGVVLRAGDRPEAGDTNRLLLPRAYVEADRLVRAVRAREGLHFYAPWTADTTEAWLRRFET